MAFLGHIVTKDGIMIDPNKIETVHDWIRPTSATEIRSFIGLTSYYRCFVEGFSSNASLLTRLTLIYVSPLTRLTHKNEPFQWLDECKASFQKFKTLLTTTLILTVLVEGEGFMVYFDSSRIGLGYVLIQKGK
ncbi:uncharacterized mitochondrial protein AtMg00860-like [Lycium barbarum]|uniref:uncharacterized mitochondrial protein AtMg00860-like n=1 Tax=Lycium barbarum TaxID=112863 RepID=UPI00293E0121|nr:uncharacterized mitochondrial protein AtMg00860-like [Lycium barbarum]